MSPRRPGKGVVDPIRPPDNAVPLNPRNSKEASAEVSQVEPEMTDQNQKEQQGRRPIVSPVPERPTEQEVLEHNTTHSPPQAWCPHCAKATAKSDPHRRERREVPDVEPEFKEVPTISMDLMYLYEKGGQPPLIAIDHESGRLWSYAPRDETQSWVAMDRSRNVSHRTSTMQVTRQ